MKNPFSGLAERLKTSINNNIEKSMITMVDTIVKDAQDNASFDPKIPPAIKSSGVVKDADGNMVISILLDLNEAPEAAAFEYGSGLYSKKGKKYIIAPKNASKLKFPISRWPNYQPPPNVDFAVFPGPISSKGYVMHPGVKGQHYIQKAVNANRRSFRGLGLAVLKGWREVVPPVIIIGEEE